MNEAKLTPGKQGTAHTVVSENNTAKTVGSGSLPVFGTPMMLALMEQAACDCIADALDAGETSVGTLVNINHTAASPLGREITATATLESAAGRKVSFKITARDNKGEIGSGLHERFIVDEVRFMEKL